MRSIWYPRRYRIPGGTGSSTQAKYSALKSQQRNAVVGA